MRKRSAFFLMILMFALLACDSNYTPKPYGYYRIEMPQKNYQLLDTSFVPCVFEYPVYASIKKENSETEGASWFTIDFPYFKGNLYLTYQQLHGDLARHLEDSRKLTMKHIPKASAINESILSDTARDVYGLLYTIDGNETASALQFYVTDSSHHFFRGSLYFYTSPNNDSLRPVLDFVRADVLHMLETFRWKEKN